jgi:hypothetical protein
MSVPGWPQLFCLTPRGLRARLIADCPRRLLLDARILNSVSKLVAHAFAAGQYPLINCQCPSTAHPERIRPITDGFLPSRAAATSL